MAGIEELVKASQMIGAGARVAEGVGNYRQGKANARILNAQANQVAMNTAMEESRLRRSQAQEIAAQVASIGGRGIAPSGSIVDVIRQNAENAEADALTLRYRGDIEQAGLKAQAKMAAFEGRQQLYAGVSGAGSKLLTSWGEDARRQRRKPTAGVY
jgi:hypothetical protein